MKKVLTIVLGLAVAILAGCSDGLVGVQGTVTYDGKPVVDGVISFTADNGTGTAYESRIVNDNGRYKIRCAPGEMRVRIHGFRMEEYEFIAFPGAPPETREGRQNYIPQQYNQGATLTVTVSPSGGTHDFSLEAVP